MKKLLLLLFTVTQCVRAQAPEDLSYYLPQNISYNTDIPTPKSVIGHEVGEWHVTHDKLVEYMKTLAEASDRISIEDRGTTYEGRPLLLLTITSPENHRNIENIRREHLKLSEPGSGSLSTGDMPVVVYQGFSIHGNEPSGSNAALVAAYYLAAGESPEIDEILDHTVILFDPCFNPDGLQRFAYWANTNKSRNLNPDKNEREYHEVWPGGRTNHYWFDMNRDWLPVQLPESRARIATYHRWLPNILTDHHEMGTNSTFFFQPGEPNRVHPLTPQMNQELTKQIGKFHIKALNNIGSLYYSEENYDDFFYGKGSTFPDINGGIGILFEQGSSRGHIQESDNGLLTFPFTIRNQFTTALSTLEAASNMRKQLLDYQRSFYTDTRSQASKGKGKALVFGDEKDAAKAYHLAEILKRQQIKVYDLAGDFTENKKHYKEGFAYMVPKNQKNIKLIEAMFETRTEFTDSLFYDISSWTFPLAFDLDYGETALSHAGQEISDLRLREGKINRQSNYAYLLEWHEYYTPKALYQILRKGIRAKVGKTPFTIEDREYDYGTIMIPVQNQKMDSGALYVFLQKVAEESHLEIDGVSTGHAVGSDLGSNQFKTLEMPQVAMLTGNGISPYDAGEIWHLFDQRYDIPITKIDESYFNRVNLDKYNVLILTSTRGSLNTDIKEKLQTWVKNGGVLIGYRQAVNWLKNNEFIDPELRKKEITAKDVTYEQQQDFRGAQVTGGAIFEADVDRSHPINFGYKNDKIALFRNTNIFMEPDEQSYNNPIIYTDDPLLSGYISEENLEQLKGSVPFKVFRSGKGKVIIFTDNTNFRAFWYGTNKLLMNAIFFNKLM
ncbi:M14 family zinc carboxypeptidase [Sinomicrobium weinanense]|uniref:Zinc carboxypeptidase n=1 Tax=Sinomicrobium weinanense TaxID=2842200 RepID=A0A926JTR6_9FLAO|nr:M14 family zinc carboxypeptidase [Sinomicrobium weinanense]MBC9797385.1 zinc carboxypeptidase [Sinomicrobium weinanense]MBU3123384.1 zinc carboxypeptidase [Sinomicrobium weinanense]